MASPFKIAIAFMGLLCTLTAAHAQQNKAEVKTLIEINSLPRLINALNLTSENALNRNIYFFDTNDLQLFKRGGIIRLRIADDMSFETTVKIRPLYEEQVIDDEIISKKGFKCEVDASFSNATSSCSYSKENTPLKKQTPLKEQLSKKQKKFLEDQLDQKIKFDQLVKLGPIKSTCYKKILIQKREYSIELWNIANESLVEVSTKGDEREIEEMRQDLKLLLERLNIQADNAGTQKTTRALQILTSP